MLEALFRVLDQYGPAIGVLFIFAAILFIQVKGQTDTQEKMNALAIDLNAQARSLSKQLVESLQIQGHLEEENQHMQEQFKFLKESCERESKELKERISALETDLFESQKLTSTQERQIKELQEEVKRLKV